MVDRVRNPDRTESVRDAAGTVSDRNRGHALTAVRPRVDLNHGAGKALGDPDEAAAHGDRGRTARGDDRLLNGVRLRVDPLDQAPVGIRDPDRAYSRRDGVR